MFHDDFITYKIAEMTSKLNDIKAIKQQYLAQLLLLKETIGDYKELLHQKYDLTDSSVKEFFNAKDDLLRR
jgi:hypothetical protein